MLRSWGRTAVRIVSSRERTFCSSTVVVTREAGMTVPSAIPIGPVLAPSAAVGTTNSTYFWPKRVVGLIATVTSAGTCLARSGSRPSLITAWLPSWVTSRICPITMPCIRTSPNFGSCRPARSALTVTQVTGVNAFW